MNVKSTGATYQKPAPLLTAEEKNAQKKQGGQSEANRLNAEIKQTEAEIKETMKEVQKAAEESVGGASEKVQLLQSKLMMQQQEITTKQMQIKEIESPPRFDEYTTTKDMAEEPDNIYRLEEKDGTQNIIFNREVEPLP